MYSAASSMSSSREAGYSRSESTPAYQRPTNPYVPQLQSTSATAGPMLQILATALGQSRQTLERLQVRMVVWAGGSFVWGRGEGGCDVFAQCRGGGGRHNGGVRGLGCWVTNFVTAGVGGGGRGAVLQILATALGQSRQTVERLQVRTIGGGGLLFAGGEGGGGAVMFSRNAGGVSTQWRGEGTRVCWVKKGWEGEVGGLCCRSWLQQSVSHALHWSACRYDRGGGTVCVSVVVQTVCSK